MKSGIQMNFLERRLRADRALSQLARMVHDATETLSSREQRGIYQLESTLAAGSKTALPAVRVWIKSTFVARWRAFSIFVLVFVRSLFARVCAYSRRALARARAGRMERPQTFLASRVHDVFARIRDVRREVRQPGRPAPR